MKELLAVLALCATLVPYSDEATSPLATPEAFAGELVAASPPALLEGAAQQAVERGRQIFALAGGCGCHTSAGGPVGAGGEAIATPFGKFYGTNITPDPDTGIGGWSDGELEAAIRRGVLRSGEAEAPVMPYYWYAGMSDADVANLIAYLRTLAPVRRENRAHEEELPLSRLAYRAWRLLFAEMPASAPEAPAAGVERGRYLVDHVSLCADCHTRRSRLGTIDRALYLAGTTEGPGGESVPNITPHETGIADWDSADIAALLESGMMPNFDNVQGAMADVIDGVGGGPGYKDAPAADRLAIAEYLRSVAPIEHEVDD